MPESLAIGLLGSMRWYILVHRDHYSYQLMLVSYRLNDDRKSWTPVSDNGRLEIVQSGIECHRAGIMLQGVG